MSEDRYELFKLMLQAGDALKSFRLSEIPPGIFKTLHLIEKYGEEMNLNGIQGKAMSVSDISASYKVSKPAISRMLKDCEQKGYVVRTSPSEDKRRSVLFITQLGLDSLKKAHEDVKEASLYFMEMIGKEDVETLKRIIRKLITCIEDTEKGVEAYDETKEVS